MLWERLLRMKNSKQTLPLGRRAHETRPASQRARPALRRKNAVQGAGERGPALPPGGGGPAGCFQGPPERPACRPHSRREGRPRVAQLGLPVSGRKPGPANCKLQPAEEPWRAEGPQNSRGGPRPSVWKMPGCCRRGPPSSATRQPPPPRPALLLVCELRPVRRRLTQNDAVGLFRRLPHDPHGREPHLREHQPHRGARGCGREGLREPGPLGGFPGL